MGQLWERVKRFARAQSLQANEYVYETLSNDEDDDLRKAIDEALSSKTSKQDAARSHTNTPRETVKTEKDKAFEILGLAQSATNDDIKSRYKKLMKEFHPDAVASAALSKQEYARKKAQEINGAYQYLRKLRKF